MVRLFCYRPAGAGLALIVLAACNLDGGVGYIEIKTVPVAAGPQPSLYVDAERLEPLKKGTAVLRQQVGTRKLQTDGSGGQLVLICDIVVKKNRITTVTVSALDRPPRCQCRTSAGTDTASNRTCLS